MIEPKPARRRLGTSYDVARRAGVSQSAVSRCFRPGGASVSPKTRALIMAAADELGYRPNAIAQGLITRRSNLVAVIISNLTNLYYPEVLAELTAKLSAQGIRVLLFTLAAESEIDEVLDQVWRYQVDGAVRTVVQGAVVHLHIWHDVALEILGELIGLARHPEAAARGVPGWHDDDHRLRFLRGDKVIENETGAAHRRPPMV